MRQKYQEGYLELLEKVKKKLPNYYGVLLSSRHPEIDSRQAYNVLHSGVQNWTILNALAEISGINEIVKIDENL